MTGTRLDGIVRSPRLRPRAVYAAAALFILGPLLLPGFIFGLDMVFGPVIRVPHFTDNTFPFYLVLRALNLVLAADLIQKVLLFLILLISGISAHGLTEYVLRGTPLKKITVHTTFDMPAVDTWGPYFTGLFYMVNPFTYERFIDGHFELLIGYALLPFFILSLLELMFSRSPIVQWAVRTGVWAAVIASISIHSVGFIFILAAVSLGLAAYQARHDRKRLTVLAARVAAALGVFLFICSFWLVPLAMGTSARSELITAFDDRHLQTFRTDGQSGTGVIGNIISLYGYWGEREGRIVDTRDFMPLWYVPLILTLVLAIAGFYRARRHPAVITIAAGGVAGIVLAAGTVATIFAPLNRLLVQYVPYFSGYREPQKFSSLLVLAYAVLGGIGLQALVSRGRTRQWPPGRIKVVAVVLAALPFLYAPAMLWGFAGQLKTSHYPSDWKEANRHHLRHSGNRTLFLPWHQYMYFDFAGRNIANPAPAFFGGTVISGDNAEIGLIESQNRTPTSKRVEAMIEFSNDTAYVSRSLNQLGVTHVVLFKTVDWGAYGFLDSHPALRVVQDTPTLRVYQFHPL